MLPFANSRSTAACISSFCRRNSISSGCSGFSASTIGNGSHSFLWFLYCNSSVASRCIGAFCPTIGTKLATHLHVLKIRSCIFKLHSLTRRSSATLRPQAASGRSTLRWGASSVTHIPKAESPCLIAVCVCGSFYAHQRIRSRNGRSRSIGMALPSSRHNENLLSVRRYIFRRYCCSCLSYSSTQSTKPRKCSRSSTVSASMRSITSASSGHFISLLAISSLCWPLAPTRRSTGRSAIRRRSG